MNLYGSLVATHVVIAILGVGQLPALAMLGRSARSTGDSPETLATRVSPFFRNLRIASALLFLTGAALDLVSGGTWHHYWWFRGSVGLLVVAGVLLGLAKRASVRVGGATVIERNAWLACVTVALIAVLMELKPQ